MSDPTPPTPPEPSEPTPAAPTPPNPMPPAPDPSAPMPPPGYGPVGYAPMPPPQMYPQPSGSETPVLGIVAVVLSVILAPIGAVLGIITLATAKGRKAAKILGSIAVAVGLAITAGFVVLIVVAVHTIQNADHVSNEFVTDLQNNHVSAAYALTSPKFKATTSESELAGVATANSDVLAAPRHIYSTHIQTSAPGGTFTDIVYAVEGTQIKYLEVQLVKVNGNWRVQYIGPKDQP